MSGVNSSYIGGSSSLDTQDLDYRFFAVDGKQKMSTTPVATPSPPDRNDVVHVPPSPAGLPPRPPRKSTSGSIGRSVPRVARKTLEHVAASSSAESGEDRYREGSHASSTPRSMLQYPIDDSEGEEKIATAVVEAGRTPSTSVSGTPQIVSGSNRSVLVDEHTDETETRKPSLGEASVKTMAAVENLQAAFGLREESGSSEDDCDDNYEDCVSQGHRSIDKCGSGSNSCGDLTEASRAICNPIYGPTSRAVGRQPERKMRTVAGWLNFATRSKSASRVSPSSKVSSNGKNQGVVHSSRNINYFNSSGGGEKGSEVSGNQDLDINDMEKGRMGDRCSMMVGNKPILDSPPRKKGKHANYVKR